MLTTQRYGEDIPETVIDLDNESGTVTAMGDLAEFNRAKARSAILGAISTDEELDETTIKGRIEGFNHGMVAKALRDLVDEGKVNRQGEGRKGKPYLYKLASAWVM